MKIVVIYRFLNSFKIFMFIINMSYTYNKVIGLHLHVTSVMLSVPPGGFPSILLKSHTLFFHNWKDI